MKLLRLNYEATLQHYPGYVDQAVKSMSQKFRRAKQQMPDPSTMLWWLEWGGGGVTERPSLGQVTARLYCAYEKRKTAIHFPDPALNDNSGDHLPHHVQSYYRNSVDPAKMRHAAIFKIRNPNGSIDDAIALGGYSYKGAIAIHYLIVGHPWIEGIDEEQLIELQGTRAHFTFGLKDLARERYDAAGEGNDFSFGSKTMRRLTLAEIQPHVQGKTFNWSLF